MATIFDIAKKTGFSTMTVSRAINEPDKVNEKTREIILEKIKELGYTPNTAAKSLATNCTNIIFVYIPKDLNTLHPFVMQSVAAIGERLGESGYSFYLSRKPYNNESCDGIIAMGLTLKEEAALEELKNRKPFVLFGRMNGDGNWVDVDNYAGSRKITEYVVDKGYQSIGYIGISQDKRYAKERYDAFRQCMTDKGREVSDSAVTMVDNNELCGFEAAQGLIDSNSLDAIICASDLLALGCIRALSNRGIKIPDEVAVCGFDGLGFETLTYPHITTIEQPIHEVGLRLAETIIKAIKCNNAKFESVLVEPKLVIHESA